jgi:hypothetical protein
MAEYNPDEHKAGDVVDKLEEATPEEKDQIVAAELKGKQRKSVLEAAGVDVGARMDGSGRVLNDWEVLPEDQAGGHAYGDETPAN